MNFPEQPGPSQSSNSGPEQKNISSDSDDSATDRYQTERELEEMSGSETPGTVGDRISSLLEEADIPSNENTVEATRKLLAAGDAQELVQLTYKLTDSKDRPRELMDEIMKIVAQEKGIELDTA